MKNRIISAALIAILSAFALSSCDFLLGDVADAGEVTVVIEAADGSYEIHRAELSEVKNKSEGAKGILEHLCECDGLSLEIIDSSYGAYVGSIGSVKESAADGLYVIVYTSASADGYAGGPTTEYEGTVMYQSGVGLSAMRVDAGTVILFRLEKSPY